MCMEKAKLNIHTLPQVKARGTKVPEVWYSSPYCTPEAEVARGNEDSWSATNERENSSKKDEEKARKSRVWVSVEPSTDSWALGILTYAMLTGTHPWPETDTRCHAYVKYREWFDRSKGPDDDLDVWAEPQTASVHNANYLKEAGLGRQDHNPKAPQFASFTPLACSFFQSFLDPRPQLRCKPEDALSYLGGEWVMEKERVRLERERKKNRGKGAIRNMKEMEGRGQR